MSQTTKAEYTNLADAFNFFNYNLFENKLPDCLITLQRQSNSRGYFSPDRFSSRQDEGTIDEIAMNPDTFEDRSDTDILSTLVHEMTHVWQQHFGRAPRSSYHDRQWAAEMLLVGLVPSSTGEPGGKMTGQRMTHYIQKGGKFQVFCAVFLDNTKGLAWNSAGGAGRGGAPALPRVSKQKFTCPQCEQNAWAKPTAKLACGECDCEMIMN